MCSSATLPHPTPRTHTQKQTCMPFIVKHETPRKEWMLRREPIVPHREKECVYISPTPALPDILCPMSQHHQKAHREHKAKGLEPPVKRDSHRLQAEKGTRANPGHQRLVMYGDSVDPPQRQLRNSPGGAGSYQLAFTSCGEEPGSSYSENHRKQSPHGCPDNLTGQAISKRCVPLKRGFQGQKGTEHTYHRHPMGL